jgi:D-aminoacyl-tRNA deacylase
VRIVVQRVSRAEVRVEGRSVASAGRGLLIFLAVEKGDTGDLALLAAEKIALLRVFPEPGGGDNKMSRSVEDVGGEVLVVSQFTLAGSLRKGRRPSFDGAAPPAEAELLCDLFVRSLRERGLRVSTGVFGAMMDVDLVNDGPVTFYLQSLPGGEFGP